jgi:hypothetical protein
VIIMRSNAARAHGLSARALCLAVSFCLASTPLAAFGAEKGRVNVPGVYGFLPLSSGPYPMSASAEDKDGKAIRCDDWDWDPHNPVAGKMRVIDKYSSGVGSLKHTFTFTTGPEEGAARVVVKCLVGRNKDIAAEGFVLVSTKRGEKREEDKDKQQAQSSPPAASGGGGNPIGNVLLIGGLVAGAAAVASAAGGGSSGGSSSSSSSSGACLRWDCRGVGGCITAYGGSNTGGFNYSSLSACQAARPNDLVSSCSSGSC